MDYIIEYIDPAMIPIAFALFFIGNWIKGSSVRDEWIPWLLMPIGIGIVGLWLCAQAIPDGIGQWLVLIVNSLIQGVLCAALAVTGDQLAKQSRKLTGEPTVTITQKEFESIAEAMGVSGKELQATLDAAKATTSR